MYYHHLGCTTYASISGLLKAEVSRVLSAAPSRERTGLQAAWKQSTLRCGQVTTALELQSGEFKGVMGGALTEPRVAAVAVEPFPPEPSHLPAPSLLLQERSLGTGPPHPAWHTGGFSREGPRFQKRLLT